MNSEIHEIVVEIGIDCPRENVWKIMIDRLSDWWPGDFLCLPGAKKIQFEPVAGGRLFETTPEGGHLLWANVLIIAPGEAIEMAGHVTPTFGGPSVTQWRMGLTDGENGATKFRLSNSVIGHFSPESQAEVKGGLEYLTGALKAFCEKK
jgi:uncharacterized protein YndB with AHSA1/START domain